MQKKRIKVKEVTVHTRVNGEIKKTVLPVSKDGYYGSNVITGGVYRRGEDAVTSDAINGKGNKRPEKRYGGN